VNHANRLPRFGRGLLLSVGFLLELQAGSLRADTNAVGHVVFLRGQVAARTGESDTGMPRLLGQDAPVLASDVVETGVDSFAVIEFIDKARMTVRPNTRLRIREYRQEGQAKAHIRLDQGGIQTTPGRVAQQDPAAVTIDTPVATLKPGNAELTARLCNDQDCKTATTAETGDNVARVIDLAGVALAVGATGERVLQLGSSIQLADRIKTLEKSHLVLLFRDGGKITLTADSAFQISEYRYDPNRKDGQSVIHLLSGGLRALTGAIGRDNHKNYRITTPVATIGIRGTGFDLYCSGTCVASPDDRSAGLYSYVWKDAITLTNPSGTYVQDENRAGYIASPNSPAIAIAEMPTGFTRSPVPRPDLIKTPPPADKTVARGLYVNVKNREGRVEVRSPTGQTTTLVKGATGYVDSRGMVTTALSPEQTPLPETVPSPDTPLTTLNSDYANWTEIPNNDRTGCEVE